MWHRENGRPSSPLVVAGSRVLRRAVRGAVGVAVEQPERVGPDVAREAAVGDAERHASLTVA